MAAALRVDARPLPDRAQWTAAIRAQAGATLFHEWDWLVLTARVLGLRFVPLGMWRDADLVGVVPAVLRSRGPVTTLNWVPYPYVGPLAPPEDLGAVLDALRLWQRRQRVAIARLGFPPTASPDPKVLRDHGYAVESHATMTLTLANRSPDEIESAVRASTRKQVRKAERAGVSVEAATRDDVVDVLPAVIAEAFALRGMASHYPDAIGAAVWERYGDDPGAHFAAARLEGRTVGVIATLGAGDRAYLALGGAHRDVRDVYASALLHLDAIRWAHDAGFRALDMVGAPDPGIALYKAAFGAQPEPFTVGQRVNSRLYALAQRGHQMWTSRRAGVATPRG